MWRSTVGFGTLLVIRPVSEGTERRSGQASTTASQVSWRERARVHNETETHTEKRSSDSGGSEMEGSGGSKSEGAGDGPLQPPAGPSSGNTQTLMSLIVC